MAIKVSVLLSLFMIIYLSASLVFISDCQESYPISLLVYNQQTRPVNLTFNTDIAFRGILLGAMRKIQAANESFTFTIEDNLNYGPFLVSVNRWAGDPAKHTYWELLVKLKNGTIIRPDVGVGCYIPNPYDTVILKFTTW